MKQLTIIMLALAIGALTACGGSSPDLPPVLGDSAPVADAAGASSSSGSSSGGRDPSLDAGAGMLDGGSAEGSLSSSDAGSQLSDSGTTVVDSGTTDVDAGTTTDAGFVQHDAASEAESPDAVADSGAPSEASAGDSSSPDASPDAGLTCSEPFTSCGSGCCPGSECVSLISACLIPCNTSADCPAAYPHCSFQPPPGPQNYCNN